MTFHTSVKRRKKLSILTIKTSFVVFLLIIFMPRTLDKLMGHIALGLSFRPSVRASFKFIKTQLEISDMDSSPNIIDMYFF